MGAVGFDRFSRPIFDLTTLSTPSIVSQLDLLAKAGVVDGISTPNYNVAFDEALRAVTAPGTAPARPKLVILVVGGPHDAAAYGSYRGGHMRLAFNGTARPWPVCVVQVGVGLIPQDVGRLRRIALDTGGQHLQAATVGELADRVAQCRAGALGQESPLAQKVSLTRKARALTVSLARRGTATFLLGAPGVAKAAFTLQEPGGRVRTEAKPGPGAVFVRGDTYAFIRVSGARKGKWTVKLTASKRVQATFRVMAEAKPAT